ncbi:hypothetical protein EJ08DRAFT_623128 [Tothia fuscella]|uniref:Laccase n=1 Tax=Tothia fuscella TaxID=1048955 RepID=A0A9P4P3L6_9PEZI|nr:hypothetical protein EJ08DRAFT_623128 [Tothia fuscella]
MRLLFLPLLLCSFSVAKTVTYDWEVDWTTACPDGFCRPVIGINGAWPCPLVEANLGDTIIMNVKNRLGNETTSIHPHGIFQKGTPQMDGVAGVTQCPIPAGGSFTHSFVANPAGTRWYHSHDKAQYPDGLRSPMIIHDREWERSLGFEEQFVFSVSDWYHTQFPYLIHEFFDGGNFNGRTTRGAMPMPDSSLINDTESITLEIEPNKKYLLRIVSMAALFPHQISIVEDHDMTIVAIDGFPTKPKDASAIVISAGQRYDVLITGKANVTKDYTITSEMLDSNMTRTGFLKYISNSTNPSSKQQKQNYKRATVVPIDDFILEPADGQPLLTGVDKSITLPVSYTGKADRRSTRIKLGNASYVSPKVPTLFTALTTGSDAENPIVYGDSVNPYVIRTGQVVQIIVQNDDDIQHPMHLHGYEFQVVARGAGVWDGDESKLPKMPMKRDTANTPARGHLVIRIKANNPGVWVFHCHMEFHVEGGMMATIIESPATLQKTVRISNAQLDICRDQGIPTEGNCSGDTLNVLDTSKCNKDPPEEDWGALINPPVAKRALGRRNVRRDL